MEAAPTVDQMAPSSPRSEPQGDDRGEVAGPDTVEAQKGTQGVNRTVSTPVIPPTTTGGNDVEWMRDV